MERLDGIEIPLDLAETLRILNGTNCPDPVCDGKLQVQYKANDKEPGFNGLTTLFWAKASCYKCGLEVDLSSVRVVFALSSKKKVQS